MPTGFPPPSDPAPLFEIYADGGVIIEEAGPCQRVTFCVMRHGPDGLVRVPVVALVLPNASMIAVSQQFATAAQLAPDEIGKPMGSG